MTQNFKSKYIKIIDGIYPKTVDGPLDEGQLNKFVSYVHTAPHKLSKISIKIDKNLRTDLKKKNFGLVDISMAIYERLVADCGAQLSLFAPAVLGGVELLMGSPERRLRERAAATFVVFVTKGCTPAAGYALSMFSLDAVRKHYAAFLRSPEEADALLGVQALRAGAARPGPG